MRIRVVCSSSVALLPVLFACSSGIDPELQDLREHAATVVVIAPTTGACTAGGGLPLRVRLSVDGWMEEPQLVDIAAGSVTTFEPGVHDVSLQYDAFGCATPFHRLETTFERDESRLVLVTNRGAVGTESVIEAPLMPPVTDDGRAVYAFNLSGQVATLGLDEDDDGEADAPVTLDDGAYLHVVRSDVDHAHDLVADVGVQRVESEVAPPVGSIDWTVDVALCVLWSDPDVRMQCFPGAAGGVQVYLSDPAVRFH